jgi:3-dehydroquinate synthase
MTKIISSLKEARGFLEKYPRVYLVTSVKLSEKLGWAINELGISNLQTILIPDGEKSKEWKELQKLLAKMSELGVDRSSLLIALGGGSVGDVVGFASSIYLRGVPFIQIPTTLLSQVDSAHGGKTGIDFLGYKNQVGSFHLPEAVVIDKRFIEKLSEKQVIDGLGEVIKAGFIKDPSILRLLEKEKVESIQKSKSLLQIIKKTIAVKNYYTQADFKENKIRQILNVGHTVGHAIELRYKIGHGLAVLYGMERELAVTEKMGLTKKGTRDNFINLLKSLGIVLDKEMKPDWKTVLHDKKIVGDEIAFPVVAKEGVSTIKVIKLNNLKKFI